MSGRHIYHRLRQKLCQLLNPALCLTCGVPVTAEQFICQHCIEALQTVPNPCSSCGLTNNTSDSICPSCRFQPPRWDNMIAPLIYSDNTRKIIQDLKFNDQLHHANALLTHIYPFFRGHPVDILLPVPLHQSRLLDRGYNQAEEIATILSGLLDIPVDRNSLKRIRATESQSGLSLNKRQQNILKAFQYTAVQAYQSVAIIDDIVTTGSTVSEICKVLKRAGISHIEIWSLSRALKDD